MLACAVREGRDSVAAALADSSHRIAAHRSSTRVHRAEVKTRRMYSSGWDLVETTATAPEKLEEVAVEDLPEELREREFPSSRKNIEEIVFEGAFGGKGTALSS